MERRWLVVALLLNLYTYPLFVGMNLCYLTEGVQAYAEQQRG